MFSAFPHIFVWGSCFWFCVPSASASSASALSHLPAQSCRLRAGVALGDIAAAFAWQTWRLWHWAGSGGEFGRRWSSFDPTWEEALASCGSCHCACVGCALFSNTFVLHFMFCCVLLYQAERHIVACHLVGRWCGMPQGCVLGANAWFVTKYDSKGDGLMRLAGHT